MTYQKFITFRFPLDMPDEEIAASLKAEGYANEDGTTSVEGTASHTIGDDHFEVRFPVEIAQ